MHKDNRFIILGAGLIITAVMYFTVLNYQNNFAPAWNPADIFSSLEQHDHKIGFEVVIKDEQGNIISRPQGRLAGMRFIDSWAQAIQCGNYRRNQGQATLNGVDKQFLAQDFIAITHTCGCCSRSGTKTVAILSHHSDGVLLPTDVT
jgi:hypothetical protein